MSSIDQVKEHMEVIGADGVHVGTVDRVEGDQVRLSANAAVAVQFTEEEDESQGG